MRTETSIGSIDPAFARCLPNGTGPSFMILFFSLGTIPTCCDVNLPIFQIVGAHGIVQKLQPERENIRHSFHYIIFITGTNKKKLLTFI